MIGIRTIEYRQFTETELFGAYGLFVSFGEVDEMSDIKLIAHTIVDYVKEVKDVSKFVVFDFRGVVEYLPEFKILNSVLIDNGFFTFAYIDGDNIPPFYKGFFGVIQFVKSKDFVPVDSKVIMYEPEVEKEDDILQLVLNEPKTREGLRKGLLLDRKAVDGQKVLNFLSGSKYKWNVYYKTKAPFVVVVYSSGA